MCCEMSSVCCKMSRVLAPASEDVMPPVGSGRD